MQTFENLNKENFWNALMDKYPNAMKVFCDWIDEYKKSVQWDALFGNIFPTEKKIKFHDIPLAMQTGIWFQFVSDRGGCQYEIDIFEYEVDEDITKYMEHLEADLTN